MKCIGYDTTMVPPLPDALTSGGYPLDTSPSAFGWLRDSTDAIEDAAELQARMEQDGYLFLPGYLDREEVRGIRREICEILSQEGLLDPAAPIEDALSREGIEMYFRPDLANGSDRLKRLLYGEAMKQLYQRLLGGEVGHFDYTWFRAIAKGKGTYPHCDVVYMGRGTHQMYTAWVPFGDVPLEIGGLVVLEGSHRNEELNEYRSLDVDTACQNVPGQSSLNAHGYEGFGVLDPDMPKLQRKFGQRLLTSPHYRMGDLLTFSIYTVHGSLDNTTRYIRMSSDSRYQLASAPFDERWVGENPPGHGGQMVREMIC